MSTSKSPAQRSDEWLKRASELREIAEHFSDPSARDDLMRLADQWEKMAKREVFRIKGRGSDG